MPKPISVLLIHTGTDQSDVILSMIARAAGSSFRVDVASSLTDALEQLAEKVIDTLVVDLTRIHADNVKTLRQIHDQHPRTALIALVESESDLTPMNATERIIHDAVPKSNLSPRLLELTLRYAADQKAVQTPARKVGDPFLMLIQSLKDFAIFSMDTSGQVTFWNSGAEQILGFTESEILGKEGRVIFTPEDRARGVPEQEMRTAVREGRAVDERWHVKADGSHFYASGMMYALYDESGRSVGFTKVIRDLTDRELANAQRDSLLETALTARSEAEQAIKLKEQFLGLISHELRTPLASIVGFASMMSSKNMSWPEESMAEFATIIGDEAMRMSGLIEQLMDHTRQQTGTLKVDLKLTSLAEIVESAMVQLRALTEHHQLLIHVSPDLPSLYADPERIAQVLTNLVGNAARYSPRETMITIRASSQNAYIQVDVIDEGRGIPLDQREKVFEAFHQLDRTGTKGIGLGLALCKNLIERHNGRIWIQNHDGPGTIISFTLPVADSDSDAS